VDDCTGKVRESLLDTISATIDAFNQFAKETGAASAASTQKLGQAAEQLDAIGQELRACRTS
jgi:ABC-type transporter Mla subunit MlaD